jgi:hypothetical protein
VWKVPQVEGRKFAVLRIGVRDSGKINKVGSRDFVGERKPVLKNESFQTN